MSYKKYPKKVKIMISHLKDIRLFPSLKIPRNTAMHWIKSSKDNLNELDDITPIEMDLFNKVCELQKQLESEKQLRLLLNKIKKIAPLNKNSDKVIDSSKRQKMIKAIEEALPYAKLRDCLNIIGLSKPTYYRWRSEFSPKLNKDGYVLRKTNNQLSNSEVYKLKNYLESQRYMHFPIHGLFYHALKNDDVICSKQTWYKYAKVFGVKRWNQLPKYKKEYQEGIRADCVNQIWHIDVTQFKIHGKTIYLQVIMDNFSRYIINYKITESIGALSTVETIKDAEKKLNNHYNDRNLMMDGGPENVNRHVEKLLIAKNINRVIAKVDMRFSNSMIESLFRSMKNNYLYYQKIRSLSKFKTKVKYYVKEHNLNIPHSAFKGATPHEVYFEKWTIEDEQELKEKIANRVKERQKECFNSFLN